MSELNFYAVPFLAYVLIAHPATYKIVRGIFGNWVANAEGLATFPGLLLHALVYIIVVGWFMQVLPRKSGFMTRGDQQDAESAHWIVRNELV